MPLLETCTRCNRSLPVERFYQSLSKGRSYLRSWCRECALSYWREYARKKREEERKRLEKERT